MNEYTPSTDDVRQDYSFPWDDEQWGDPRERAFDRWLASHDAELRQSVLKEAWLAVHVTRFGAAWTQPDTYYAGVIHARNIIEGLKIKEE